MLCISCGKQINIQYVYRSGKLTSKSGCMTWIKGRYQWHKSASKREGGGVIFKFTTSKHRKKTSLYVLFVLLSFCLFLFLFFINACFTQDPHTLGTFGKYVVDAGCIRGGSFCVKGSRYALGMHTAQIAKICHFPSVRYTTHPLCTSGTWLVCTTDAVRICTVSIRYRHIWPRTQTA